MIGSSNFSRNFFQSGSRGSGVRRLAPNCRRPPRQSARRFGHSGRSRAANAYRQRSAMTVVRAKRTKHAGRQRGQTVRVL